MWRWRRGVYKDIKIYKLFILVVFFYINRIILDKIILILYKFKIVSKLYMEGF